MRNTTKWYAPLQIPNNFKKNLCEVELGLYILNLLSPSASPDSFWVLLTGYPHSISECHNLLENQYRMLAVARHLLPQFARPYIWEEALRHYREFPSDIRAYEVSEDLKIFHRRTNITVANNRFSVYESKLNVEVNFSQRKEIVWATTGKYKCELKGKKETVEIPDIIANLPHAPSHSLTGVRLRNSLQVSWAELEQTAKWMDEQRYNRGLRPEWVSRFSRVKLQLFNDTQELVDAQTLTLNRILHLVGMVSSGKSNLMKVLAVWAWRNQLHSTLVVADVLQIFELIKMFAEVGITDVAPILGNSNKASHLNRLHKAVYKSNPKEAFNQDHQAFPMAE